MTNRFIGLSKSTVHCPGIIPTEISGNDETKSQKQGLRNSEAVDIDNMCSQNSWDHEQQRILVQ